MVVTAPFLFMLVHAAPHEVIKTLPLLVTLLICGAFLPSLPLHPTPLRPPLLAMHCLI